MLFIIIINCTFGACSVRLRWAALIVVLGAFALPVQIYFADQWRSTIGIGRVDEVSVNWSILLLVVIGFGAYGLGRALRLLWSRFART